MYEDMTADLFVPTLHKLASHGVIRWLERGCEVVDLGKLHSIAGWHAAKPRPFI
jgi:hypothetical protein